MDRATVCDDVPSVDLVLSCPEWPVINEYNLNDELALVANLLKLYAVKYLI